MTTTWTTMAAGATGSAHADGVSQDAHAARTITTGPLAGRVVAAVADGHGGERYVRSGFGARAAVEAALTVLSATASGPVDPPAVWTRIWQRWRDTVLADHRGRPFTDDERRLLGDESDPLVAYGSTLIAAMTGPDGVRVWQLGDGDVLAADATGATCSPVPADPSLSAGRTTSLCSPDAGTAVRVALVPRARWLMLATDGYGNAFADDDWRAQVGADLQRALHEHGPGAVATQFPQWLRASAETGGDDASAVLLVDTGTAGGVVPTVLASDHRPQADPPATSSATAPSAAGPPRGRPGITPAPSARRRRPHPAWWAAIGVAAGAVTFGLLHLATSAGRSDPESPQTVTTTATQRLIVTVPGPTLTTTRTVTVTSTRTPAPAGSQRPGAPGERSVPSGSANTSSSPTSATKTPIEQAPPPPSTSR